MSRPECVALTSRDALEVAREQEHAGEQAERAGRAGGEQRGRCGGRRTARSGTIGDGRAALDPHERDEQGRPASTRPPVRDVAPAATSACWVRPTSTSPIAAVSSAMPARSSGRGPALAAADRARAGRCATTASAASADRQVHEEHPAPADVVGEEAADQRAGDEAHAHQPGEHALQRGVAAAGVEVGDEDERSGLPAHPRRGPAAPRKATSSLHRLRRRGERRAEQEEHHADQQQQRAGRSGPRAARRSGARRSPAPGRR